MQAQVWVGVEGKGKNSRTWGKEKNFEQVKDINIISRFIIGYK